MTNTIQKYLAKSGIDPLHFTAEFYADVDSYVGEIRAALQAPNSSVAWQYQVPELSEDGACSLFGQLAEQAYDLEMSLGGKTASNQRLLAQATMLVQFYRQHSSSDWFGIYQKRLNQQGESVLMKLAYYGAPSRAEFPLTPEFAQMSNNSSVGLSGQGRVINQVSAYRAAGGEYYTCDPKVNAEACLPILNDAGEVLGIVDSETFLEHTFVGKELALLVAVVLQLATVLDDAAH